LFKNLWNIRNSLGLFISSFFINLNLFPIDVSWICFMNFDNPTFRGWQGFTEFPNNTHNARTLIHMNTHTQTLPLGASSKTVPTNPQD
jgi:hypothetical protein